jgi:hypothetical protein
MAAPWYDLQSKLEASVKSLVDALGLGATVNTGIDDDALTLPAVIIIAETGEEFPLNTGNYKMRTTIRCRSNADDTTLAAHRTFAATVFDSIKTDTLAADLSAAVPDFTAIGINEAVLTQTRQDRSWVSEMAVQVYCCAMSLSP